MNEENVERHWERIIRTQVIMHCDNTSTMSMSKILVLHSKTKHISMKNHVLREKVEEKEIRLEYVSTKE